MIYFPDMVTGGRLRLAEGGIVDISVAETFEVKRNLWFGNSNVNLVCAPVRSKEHYLAIQACINIFTFPKMVA